MTENVTCEEMQIVCERLDKALGCKVIAASAHHPGLYDVLAPVPGKHIVLVTIELRWKDGMGWCLMDFGGNRLLGDELTNIIDDWDQADWDEQPWKQEVTHV